MLCARLLVVWVATAFGGDVLERDACSDAVPALACADGKCRTPARGRGLWRAQRPFTGHFRGTVVRESPGQAGRGEVVVVVAVGRVPVDDRLSGRV